MIRQLYVITQSRVLAAALTTVLLLSACGGGSTIQSVLNGSGPVLNFLVKNGKISQAQADTLKKDFADAGKCAADLEDSLDQIAKNDPEAKQKKLNAWLTAANFCWKPIVLRQNFAADPKVQRISQIVDGIFAAGVIFHSSSTGDRAMAPGAPKSEKALEEDLERRIKELEAAMKPE